MWIFGQHGTRQSRRRPRSNGRRSSGGGSSSRRPVAVLIHGGGWQAGKGKGTTRTEAKYFVRRGFVAVSIDYRCERAFGGDWLWLDAVADVDDSLTWPVYFPQDTADFKAGARLPRWLHGSLTSL